MAELPAPPSLLDEVNPRLVVAVTRSQKRKREEEQALVSVSSLFGAHLLARLAPGAAFGPEQGSRAPKLTTPEAMRFVCDVCQTFIRLDTTSWPPLTR